MTTVLDLIRDVLGEDLSPDLIARVSEISPAKLRELRDRHRESVGQFSLPEKADGHLRPFVTSEGLSRADLRFEEKDFDYPDVTGSKEDAIKLHLLYCHSLVIHDPLPYILDYFDQKSAPRVALTRLANYLSFLNQVRRCVEAGHLFFFDNVEDIRRARHWPPELLDWDQIKERAASIDVSHDFAAELRPVPEEVRPYLLREALNSIGKTLVANQSQGRKCDLYFPARFYRDALVLVVGVVRGTMDIREVELRVLERLLSADVPNLDTLDLEDVARIRENEECFEVWRRAIGRGLERVAMLEPAGLLEPGMETIRLIREELLDESRRLREKVKESQFVAMAQRGLGTLTSGGLALLTLTALDADYFKPGPRAAQLALSTVYELLRSFLFSASSRPKKALLRHFLLFEKKRSEPG